MNGWGQLLKRRVVQDRAAYHRRYYLKNRNKKLAYARRQQKRWRKNNPKYHTRYMREWRQGKRRRAA